MAKEMCRLCFESKTLTIGIFSNEGVELEIASIIRVHFVGEIGDVDDFPKVICSECWMKLSDFHKFYNDVNAARGKFLRDLANRQSPHFIEINCNSIECDDLIPADSVETEEVDEDGVEVESASPRNGGIDNESPENHEESENGASEAGEFYDDAGHTDEGHVYLPGELDVKYGLERDESASAGSAAGKLVNSSTSATSTKFDEDKFDKLAANYMDMACELCKNPFEKLVEMRKHYRVKHKQRNVWMKCCQKRLDLYDVVEHIQYHLNPEISKCDECGRNFLWNRDLKRHRTSHQPKQFECDICKKRVSALHILKKHILTLHTGVERQFECHICKKRCTFQHILHNHILRKHTKRLQQNGCDICKKSFATKNALRIHVRCVHERHYRQVCHICAKECNSKHSLLLHLTTHSDAKDPRVTCKICGRSYKNLRGLNSHIATHNEANQIFQCPHCPKISPNQNALSKHIGSAHNFKIHKCHLCDREFKRAIVLKEHVASHTGTYLYSCAYCPQKFKYRSKMYPHYKKMHPLEWSVDRTRDPSKDHCSSSAQ